LVASLKIVSNYLLFKKTKIKKEVKEPNESKAFSLKIDKQTCPFSFIFGCQMRVLHFTLGGFINVKI
jgi:hypothetical protein